MANENSQFDPGQVEWYNVDGEGAPPTNPNLKKWIKIGSAGAAGLIVVLLIIFFVRSWLEKSPSAQTVAEEQMTSEEEKCQSARDVEKCLAAIPSDLAQENGSDIYCQELSGSERDSCLLAAALSAADPEICADVEDATKQQSCEDGALAASLSADSDFSTCADFNDVQARTDCEAAWTLRTMLSDSCQATAELCAIGVNIDTAVAARDPDLCEVIDVAQYVDTCRELVGDGDRDGDGLSTSEEQFRGTSDYNTDSDADGLSDGEEISDYGTDPASADTDRDGFTDGTEVRAGYDPLK